MANKFQTAPFGPLKLGVVDTANPSEDLTGAVRQMQYLRFTGEDRLSVAPGLSLQMSLMDDQAVPAPVTSVLAIDKFFDGAMALAWSSVTSKVYLYCFPADLSGYYSYNGTLVTNVSVAYPIYIVWGPGSDDHSKTTAVTAQPDVSVTELLGQLVIAHTQAQDQNGLYFPTRYWNKQTASPFTSPSQTALSILPSFLCNGPDDGTNGTDVAYFTFVIAFQQAIWGAGYADGSTAGYSTGQASGLAFDPCLWKFSPPFNPNGMQISDSITLGNRLRSNRERIIGAGLAGDAMISGGSYITGQITGYGKESYYKKIVDTTYGFIGPKCMVSVGNDLYYWSSRGPMRVKGALGQYAIYQVQPPEDLWDRVFGTIPTVANPSRVVAGFDADRDQVIWVYDSSQGVRTVMAYDIRRNVFRTAAEDLGVVIQSAGVVEPVIASTSTSPQGPSTNPLIINTTNITPTSAIANFEELDPNAATEISLATGALQSNGSYTYTVWNVVAAPGAVGGTSPQPQNYSFTGLTAGTHYAWRIRGFRNGQYTDYVGPLGPSIFASASSSSTTEPAPIKLSATGISTSTTINLSVVWTIRDNAAQTEIWLAPPSAAFNLVLLTVGISGITQAQIPVLAQLLTTVPPGQASITWNVANAANGQYGVWVRHVRAGFQPSPYTATANLLPVHIPPVAGVQPPAGVQALPIKALYDTIGIATHLADREAANDTANATIIKNAIVDIGFMHCRDGGTNTAFMADIATLGTAHGIKWSIVVDGQPSSSGAVPDPTVVVSLIPAASAAWIEQYEATNEPDEAMKATAPKWTYKGQAFPGGAVAYENDLYTTLKAAPAPYSTTPVASMSIANPGPTVAGLLNGVGIPLLADLANLHNYPGSPNGPGNTVPVNSTGLTGKTVSLTVVPTSVSKNNTLLKSGTDYTISGLTLTLTVALVTTDTLTVTNPAPVPETWNLPGDQLTTGRNWTGTTLSFSGLAGKPLVTSETGNTVQPSQTQTVSGVISAVTAGDGDINGLPQICAAKYALRTYAKQFQYNVTKSPSSIVRTYYYDMSPIESNNYSIINSDGSYRVAAQSIKKLLTTIKDTTFTPGKLSYTINSTDPNWTANSSNQILFQRSDGHFFIMVWLDKVSYASGVPLSTTKASSVSTDVNTTATITISFNGVQHQQVFVYDFAVMGEDPLGPGGSQKSLGINVSTVTTTVNDSLLFFEVVG